MSGDLSGFLDVGTEFQGELTFKDMLRIDGRFNGSIRAGKTLIIGESAEVDAEIEVAHVAVSGQLRGSVRASERVELHDTARVQASLDTKILVVEEGALFEGQCSMQTGVSSPREVKSIGDLKKKVSSE